MTEIQALKQRLIDWKSRFKDLTVLVVKRYDAEIVDLITEEQLSKGLDNRGMSIKPDYSPLTVQIKLEKGQEAGFVTLKDEGDYHGATAVRFGTGTSEHVFVIFNTDPKANKLESKYGKDLLGLNPDSLEDFNDLIRDDLITTIQNAF